VPEREEERAARTRRRGNELGFWFFMVCIRFFGLRWAYGLLYLVCLYYLLFDREMVLSATPYVIRRFPGCGPVRQRLHVYRLLVSQGKQLVDRYAAISGHGVFDIELKGQDELVSVIRNSKKGAILLTSHQGNWQMAMTALGEMGKAVHLVMLPDENPALQEKLHPGQRDGKVGIISPRQYLGGVLEIMEALRKGHVVSMMGDRSYGARAGEGSVLGRKARFPYSAFSLAASAGCPVVVLQAAKVSTHRYVVDLSNVLYPGYRGRKDRAGQLQPWVQEYVSLMESFVGDYPYQCFLFRDAWKDAPEVAAA